jgi:flagellar biosynthesis protein FliR
MVLNSVLAVVEDPPPYLSVGVFSISVPNAIIIGVMIALFVLAIVVPFPKDKGQS